MKLLAVGIATLASLALAGCAAGGPAASPSPTAKAEPRFLTALHECQLTPATPGVKYADEGRTLILNTVGNDTAQYLLPVADVECVLNEVDATSATLNLIESTRALDGRQKKSWKGVDATWGYHPDSGLDLTLEDTSA